jgi:hypothetical protein
MCYWLMSGVENGEDRVATKIKSAAERIKRVLPKVSFAVCSGNIIIAKICATPCSRAVPLTRCVMAWIEICMSAPPPLGCSVSQTQFRTG